MSDVKVYDLPVVTTLLDSDYILVNASNDLKLINQKVLNNLFGGLTATQIEKLSKIIIAEDGSRFLKNNGSYALIKWSDISNAPFASLNMNQFELDTNRILGIQGYHTHTNQTDILDKFSLETGTNRLLLNNNIVGIFTWSELLEKPFASLNSNYFTVSNGVLGIDSSEVMFKSTYDTTKNGIVDNAEKVNGFTVGINVPSNAVFTDTITEVDDVLNSTSTIHALSANQGKVVNDKVVNIENGTTKTNAQKIQGVNVSETTPTSNQVLLYNETNSQYEPTTITVDVPVASTTVSGTVKIDGTTITIADGVISAVNTGTKIEDWVSGTSYLLKDLVIYSNSIYQCTTANSDATWTPANWNCVSTGADGINAYCWIKYSINQPTQDSDMTDVPSNWIGFYSGASATAPTTYTSYQWFNYKGSKGDVGTLWYVGTAITGNSTTPTVFTTGITNATVNDYYLNISTNYYYQCTLGGDDTTATWIYIGHFDGLTLNDTTISESTTYSSTKIESRLGEKQNKITVSSTLTLTVAGWDSGTKTQKVSITLNTNNVNSIIYDLSSLDMVIASGVIPSLEETTGITFKCTTIPTSDINFKVKVTVIT